MINEHIEFSMNVQRDEELEVYVVGHTIGKRIPGTYWEPPEYPEPEILGVTRADNGNEIELTEAEEIEACEEIMRLSE